MNLSQSIKIILLAFCIISMPIALTGCMTAASTANNPESLSKEDLTLSPTDAKALDDFLQGNVEQSDGLPPLPSESDSVDDQL